MRVFFSCALMCSLVAGPFTPLYAEEMPSADSGASLPTTRGEALAPFPVSLPQESATAGTISVPTTPEGATLLPQSESGEVSPLSNTSLAPSAIVTPQDTEKATGPENMRAASAPMMMAASASTPNMLLRTDTAAPQMKLPAASPTDGAFTFEYPLTIPPGRNGFSPHLALSYNSQNQSVESIAGVGWDVGIPTITRLNKKGIDVMFTDERFISSLDGELAKGSDGVFRPRVENSTFSSYFFNASDNSWTMRDTKGVAYTFGSGSATRESDPADPYGRIFRWYLEKITDPHGELITYEYSQSGGKLYPARIAYMEQESGTMLYEILFTKSARPQSAVSFAAGFKQESAEHISEIEIRTAGARTRAYTLAYDTLATAYDTLLSITESGRDEAGNTITLPPTSFSYEPRTTSTAPSDTWRQSFPGALRDTDGLSAYVFADVNGDALPDLLFANRGTDAASKKVFLNNGSGFTEDASWSLPQDEYFTFKYGATALDVNNDGLADLVQSLRYYTSGSAYSESSRVYLNTGSGWVWDRNWTIPGVFLYWGGTNEDREFEFGDINGDGLVDLMQTYDGVKVYRNTGTGWVYDPFWNLPSYIRFKNNHAQAVELNGDGLVDIVWSSKIGSTISTGVFVNAGNGHFSLRDWSGLPGQYFYYDTQDLGYRLLDLNADGLVDIAQTEGGVKKAFINHGKGWATDSAAANFLTEDFRNIFLAQTDINGDMLIDTISGNNVFLAGGKKPHVLKTITYPAGGSTSVEYVATSLATGGTRLNPKLPVPLNTVSKITTTAMGADPLITTYRYENGLFHNGSFNGAPDKKFAGFEKVTETDSAGNTKISYYHQGNTTESVRGEFEDMPEKIGFAYRTEVRNAQGALMTETITRWDRTDLGAGSSFIKKAAEVTRDFDGNTTHRDRAKTFSYDTVGNLAEEIDYGEVTANADGSFTDNSADTVARKIFTYAHNLSTNSPSSFLSEEQLLGGTTLESWAKYHYDNLSHGSLTKGNLTKTERYTGSAWQTSSKTYNAQGLPLTETDPRGNGTSYAYDAYLLYPASITNSLNQKTEYTYDYSSGKVRTKKDANGHMFETRYDGLDRPIEELVPDPDEPPTPPVLTTARTYTYTDTPNALRVLESYYVTRANPRDTYRYLDGLGRTIEERTLMEENNQYAVTEYAYDARGLLARTTLPATEQGSAYSTASSPAPLATSFAYDALGRKVSETNTVGTTAYQYDDWNTTVVDPRGVKKEYVEDARGTMVAVREYLASAPLATSYTWTVAGLLKSITDADGNVRDFAYDMLGRRLLATDLHAPTDTTFGHYNYTYDANGNLTQTLDPMGRTISYTYDALNRVLTEDASTSAGTEITYTYDTCVNGKGYLCTVSVSGGPITSYAYFSPGKPSTEIRAINGTTYTTRFTYTVSLDPERIFYPDGSIVRYAYNSAGLLEKVEKMESGESAFTSVVDDYDYGPHGRITYADFANNTDTVYTYDPAELYRLRSVKTQSAATAPAPSGTVVTTTVATSTATFYATSGDGYIYANNATWKTAHDATTGGGNSYTGKTGYLGTGKNSSNQFNINRAFLTFDTSALPDNASVVDAKLNIFVESKINQDNDGNDYLTTVAASQPSTSALANADYDLCGAITNPTEGIASTERKDISNISTSKYLTFALNATGRGWVNKTGPTKLCLREGHDAKNDPYASAKNTYNRATVRTQNYSGTASDPYLSVTYTTTTTSTTTTTTTGPILAKKVTDTAYTYDPVGNITQITDASDTKNNATIVFTYDALSRLTRASSTSATTTPFLETYTYGNTGNLLHKSDIGAYAYAGNTGDNYANPHAATLIAGQAQTYDKNGNLLSDGIRTNTFDYKNRITTTLKGGVTHRYLYDHAGERVSYFNGTATTTYANDYFNTEGATTTKHIYASGSLVATVEKTPATSTPALHIIHSDHLGGTTAVTNAKGLLEETSAYLPFGKERTIARYSSFTESRKYIGGEFDESTGLNYLGARYQNGAIGKFISQDSVFLSVGNEQDIRDKTGLTLEQYLMDPQKHNSYSYAANNPIKNKDTNGEWLDTVVDVGFMAYDLYKMGSAAYAGDWEGVSNEAGNFALDAGGALLPGVTGLGMVKRAAQGANLVGDAGKLILSESRYRHVIDRHTLDGKQFIEGKTSYFNRGVDIKSLIKNASKQPGKLNDSGYYERVIDTGKNIGVDRATGKQTTTYSVITDKKGNVITSHPGKPGRPRQR